MAACRPPNKFSISEMTIFCQIEFVQKNRFLYFARLHLVHFIQYSNLNSRTPCATVWVQRELPHKQISNGFQSFGSPNADNVKARVLHVMNMNHTKKGWAHAANRKDGAKLQTMDVSTFEWRRTSRIHLVDWEVVSRSWMESERSKRFEKETSTGLT